MSRASQVLLASVLTWAGSPSLAPAAPCDATGRVLDADGEPVVGLDVRLMEGAAPRHAVTNTEGRFDFAAVPQAAEVIAVLGEGGPNPRFVIVEDGDPVELPSTVDPAGSCEVEFGPESDRPQAADLLQLYQGLHRGFALMEQLGIKPSAALRVEINDAVASPAEVYWVGPSSFYPEEVLGARLVLGTEATTRTDSGAPDNREYHELGHHALATAFGALPRSRDDAPQNDYHHNPSSAHAWTEGFAIFFAAMVARQIEGRDDASRYRVENAWLDLEQDYRPWDLRGRESVAVAGLLWDMVDGDREGSEESLEVVESEILTGAGVDHLLVGRVHNPTRTRVVGARVTVQAEGFHGTAPVGPRVLSGGGEAWFALPLPEAIAGGDDPLSTLRLSASSRPAATDDDPISVELPALWSAISQFHSKQPQSNGRLFDVADLYQALRGRFGGEDTDGDGHTDIDQLFVAHGLFADTDGDRQYDHGEALGLTSHPGKTLEVDGTAEVWPDLMPRYRLTVPAPLRMQLAVEPSETTVFVQVSGSSWGGYLARPDAQGIIRVLPPPARRGATVSVVALAPQRRPTVLWHRDAAALLADIETRRRPHLVVQLPAVGAAGHQAGMHGGWPRLAFGGGALAALLGLVLMAIGWPRLR